MDESGSLTPVERKRYKLQMLLPGVGPEGQEKIKNSRVLVAGIGGLGSMVLQHLTAMGIGTIGFLDSDKIEEENLSHQVFYGMSDIGKLKAIVTRERLRGLNPLIRFKMLNVVLHDENASSIIPGYDIIVDTTNRNEAHSLINDNCIRYGKVMVFGTLDKLEGKVSVFNYGNGPSYRCAFPSGLNYSLPRKDLGVPGSLPAVTGAIIANEVLKAITGSPDVLSGRMMVIDIFNYENRFIEISRDEANFKID